MEVWDAGLQCWISIIGCILQIRMEWLLYPLCKWSVRLKCLVMGSEWWDLWVVGNGNGLSVYVLCIKVGLSIKRPVNMYYTIYRSLCYWVVRILVVLAICINFDCLSWFGYLVSGDWSWLGGDAALVSGFSGFCDELPLILVLLTLSQRFFAWLLWLLQAAYARFCGGFEISFN